MKTLRLLLGLVAFLAGMPLLQAQIVTTQPAIFKDTDAVTLIYDANQGNKALVGYTGNVYIWTGVITNQSTSNTDWKHVKGTSFSAPIEAEKMTPLGNNKYSITFTPRTYYPGLTSAETILKLAMVFRGEGGKPEGKGDGNSDILVSVAQNTFDLRFTNPAGVGPFLFALNTPTSVSGTSAVAADLALFLNGTKVAEQANATSITANVTLTQAGSNTLRLTATKGATTEAAEVVVQSRSAVPLAALPAGAKKDGVTYINGGTSAILSLTAPNKQFVHVIGEFNNWAATEASYMKRTPQAGSTTEADNSVDGRWWVQIDGLTAGQEYAYQFLIDGGLRVADPYAEKILTPTDDAYINASGYTVYPGLKPYPTAGANGNVSVLQSNAAGYTFQTTNFQRPKREDMVVYELLPRDFIARHDYKTLIDTLAYMQRLGVNVIELMPVNEFEGNESWGYNVSFYFAPDKYYGPKNDLKRFIDECHKRGIAVVLDMVLNQSFGQSPMVQMYFNNGKPSNNPWFNADATHPFNVGYDFNHESAFTRYFSKRVMEFWIKEYNIDGYRFDLSKGFTQKVTTDAGEWSKYDASRVAIWKDYHDFLVSVDPNTYPILEHLGSNDEEKVLSDMGLMLWGVMTHNYNEATMGYINDSNFSYGYYGSTAQGGRGWSQPNLVTYMESHDEERLMYKNLAFGNSSGAYSVKNLPTALARQELAAAFFFPVPGPKMIWQFGELGFDKSIFSCPDGTIPLPYASNGDCKLSNKAPVWEYYKDANRRHLYDVYRSLIQLKKDEPVFENPTSFTQDLSGAVKTIHLNNADQNVTVIGNFDVTPATVNPRFQKTGTWYNYLEGSSIKINKTDSTFTLAPGQYMVYLSKKVARPAGIVLATKRQKDAAALQLVALPNPAGSTATLRYELGQSAPVSVTVTNLLGATVHTVTTSTRQAAGTRELQLPVQNLANGVYLVRLNAGAQQQTVRLVVQH